MITLGIESSCDDTSVALVKDGTKILYSAVSSQIEIHKRFGGVVPEVASRKHLEAILPLLRDCVKESGVPFSNVGQIAATSGPGLLGPLLIGLTAAKALAWYYKLPLVPVNHIEAHLAAAFLYKGIAPKYPYLGLIVSGGHSNLLLAEGPRSYKCLAHTLDDAPGELFDKAARQIGLGYPGGPIIQKYGENGDANRYKLPRPMAGKGYVFSFSGLKTAVMRIVKKEKEALCIKDLCASLQKAVADTFKEKVTMAVKEFKPKRFVLAGGVAANKLLRETMKKTAERYNCEILMPSVELCTDNAAMVAAHGYFTSSLADKNSIRVNAEANFEAGEDFQIV